METTSLLDLPDELLDKISAKASDDNIGKHRDLHNLRLVCKRLNSVVAWKVLSRIVIDVDRNPSAAEDQILAFIQHRTIVCKCARKLFIRSTGQVPVTPGTMFFYPKIFVWNDLRECLGSAIASLQNVECVSWDMLEGIPDWLITSILHSIASLPSLTQFFLKFEGESVPPFRLLKGLKKLTFASDEYHLRGAEHEIAQAIANNPELTHLEIGSNQSSYSGHFSLDLAPTITLTLQHFKLYNCCFRLDAILLPHLRFLTSFHWIPHRDNNRWASRDATSSESVWKMLARERITLLELVTSEVNDDLFGYLCSFEGLSKLEIDPSTSHRTSHSETFFNIVLSKHKHSLEILGILQNDREWWFGVHNADEIMACQKLTTLTVGSGNDKGSLRNLLEKATQMPYLQNLTIVNDRGGSVIEYGIASYLRTRGKQYPHVKVAPAGIGFVLPS